MNQKDIQWRKDRLTNIKTQLMRDDLTDFQRFNLEDGLRDAKSSLRLALTADIPLDRLEQIVEAERDGRCIAIPKDHHQPMFVKTDAVDTFDKWHDVTGALGKGTSWYYEAQGVVEEVAAMAFGAGIMYHAEHTAAAALRKEQTNEQT